MGVCERKNVKSKSEDDVVQSDKGVFGVPEVLEISLKTGNSMCGFTGVSVSGQAPQWSWDRLGSTKDRGLGVFAPGALGSGGGESWG